MGQYRLPDGRILEVDDDITKENAILLQNQLSELYPEYYQPFKEEVQTTFGGHLAEVAKGIPRGLAGSFISAGEGVVNLFDMGNDSDVGEYLRGLQNQLNESSLGASEGYEDAFSSKFGAGLGSFASFFIPGAAAGKLAGLGATAKGLTAAEKLDRSQKFSRRAALGLAIPAGISAQGQNIEFAREQGEEVGAMQELLAELSGGAIGASEIFSLNNLFRYVPKDKVNLGLVDKLGFAVGTGGREAIQEAGAGLAQDLVARGIYSDKLPIGESLLDDFTVGGAVGFVSDLVFRGVLDKRGIGNTYNEDLERQQREEEEKSKFKRRDFFNQATTTTFVAPKDIQPTAPVEDAPIPESTLEFAEPPVLEEFEIVRNPNGTGSVVGLETGNVYSTEPDTESAAKKAIDLRKSLRDSFVDSAAKQNLSINGLYGNGTAYNLARKVYDPQAHLIPAQAVAALDSTINIKRKDKVKNQKQISEDIQAIKNVLGPLDESQTKNLEDRLALQQTSYPLRNTKIDKASLIGQLQTKAQKKNVPIKSFYTPKEAKKLLSPADFNSLMSERAHVIFKVAKKGVLTGESIGQKRSREKIPVSRNDFNKVFKAKNITPDLNSPAFQYIAETLTGTNSFTKMNRGQKELLLTRLRNLPRFSNPTKLPDLRPRPYSANQLNTLYTSIKGEPITTAQIKSLVKNNQTGRDLSPKELNMLRNDLIESGRAEKIKNKLVMTTDFEVRQARKAQPLNETTDQFRQRLQDLTPLQEEQIDEVVSNQESQGADVVTQEEVLLLAPPNTMKKYDTLRKNIREKMNQLGLSDVGLKFETAIRSSQGMEFIDGRPVLTGRESDVEAEYDDAFRRILVSMTKFDPDGSKSDAELESAISATIDHEAIHAIRDLDLITEGEYQRLLNFAKQYLPTIEADNQPKDAKKGDKPKTALEMIDINYASLRETGNIIALEEEYVAELFRYYRKDPSKFKGESKKTIRKIIDLIKGFFDSIFGSGFSSPIAVMEDIRLGKIGRRERNKIRSLQALDRAKERNQFVSPPKFSQTREDAEDRLQRATQRMMVAESTIRQEGGSMSRASYQRELNKLRQAEEEIRLLTDQINSTPKFSRAGITPSNILFPGATEEAVYNEYKNTNGNPKAENFRAALGAFSPTKAKRHDFVDYSQLKADLRDAVKKNMDYLWYERWGNGIPTIVGDVNMNEFSSIFGVTSAQAKPEPNLKDTLRTMIVARQIDPVNDKDKFIKELKKFNVANKNNQRLNDIAKIYETGLYKKQETGQKTATYALEVLDSSNNRFSPFSVIDRHMIRKFGMDNGTGGGINENEYRVMQAIIGLLATENYNIDGEVRTFTPRQVQALLWAHQRYDGPTKIYNEGTYESSVRHSSEEISAIKEMIDQGDFAIDRPFSGKFIHNPNYKSKTQSNIFDTDLKQNMYDAIVNSAPEVIIEFKMGKERGYLPKNIDESVPFASFLNYQRQILKKISSGNKIKFLNNLQIPHEITESAGTYDGYLNPNILLKLPGAEPAVVRSIAQLFTDAFMQDAAVTARPVEKGLLKTGLILEKPDQSAFTVQELQDITNTFEGMERAGQQVNFTLMANNKTGVTFMDPKSFSEGPYTAQDLTDFASTILEGIQGKGYTLKRYGQESEYIEYGEDQGWTPGTKSGIRGLRDRVGFTESSDIQRAALRDLYIPAYESYRQFAAEVGFEPKTVPPYLEENSALAGEADITDADIAEVQAEVIRINESLSRGVIPTYNDQANPVALKIAFDFQNAPEDMGIINDPPKFHRSNAKVPPKYEGTLNEIGRPEMPAKSFGRTLVDSTNLGTLNEMLTRGREAFVDKLTRAEQAIMRATAISPEARELNLMAETGALQALRHSDRAKGIYAMMLKAGVPTFKEGLASVEQFEHGGLIEIFAPLYQDPNVDLESLFKIYAVATRGKRLNEQGVETPVSEDAIAQAAEIASDYPIVKQVYDKFQQFNNRVIDFAVEGGILQEDRTNAQLIRDFNKKSKRKYRVDESLTPEQTRAEILGLIQAYNSTASANQVIETRGTAKIWRENSDYYPFYRQMEDQNVAGPKIASGFLSSNPLSVKMKGSKEDLNLDPLTVISKNQLAIVTAAMKNDGLQKLMRSLELSGQAQRIDDETYEGNRANLMPVMIDGEKVFFDVADPMLVNSLQTVGIDDIGGLAKFLAYPAGFLRELVTRDPGFMIANLLRDSLSSYVTSGANMVPIIDTFKNFNADMTQLEKFGIIGGYDFSNDPQDVAKFIRKEMNKSGRGRNGALSLTDSAVRLWDWLGQQTTKSDGATRQAVYDKILDLTGSQAEAAYQALEVINFSRRGLSPIFRIVTAAIPFLNARIQGLDVLYRAHSGKYSAAAKQAADETQQDFARRVALGTLARGGLLTLLTGLYYALVSDEEEYKGATREIRDDNWIIPYAEGIPALKIPIPFEVGVMYKVIPERIIDVAMGGDLNETVDSLLRQAETTLKIDPLGFQAIKPLTEAIINRSSYTGNEIVPYYKRVGLEPGYQANYNTNELARLVGETFNISPIKIEYVLRGYGGTIGGYVLGMTDAILRQTTDRDFISPRIDRMPVFKRFLQTDLGGGLQQQYYELRAESNKFQQTVNALRKQGRTDELMAYMQNHRGLAVTRPQILAIERYMRHWRKQRDAVLNTNSLSSDQKEEILEQMEMSRDMRLAFVPELRKQSDVPVITLGL